MTIEMRQEELKVKIIAVIGETFPAAKRNPENFRLARDFNLCPLR